MPPTSSTSDSCNNGYNETWRSFAATAYHNPFHHHQVTITKVKYIYQVAALGGRHLLAGSIAGDPHQYPERHPVQGSP